MSRKVTEYLQKVGLTELEAKLYEGLLETGQTTIMELAKFVKIKRITAHFNIEKLIEMGLVAETRKGSRRYVVAESPDRIGELLEQKETNLAQLKKELPQILSQMSVDQSKQTPGMNDVGVLYYEGEQGFRNVCQRSLEYSQNEIRFLSDLSEWHKVYTEEYDEKHYIPQRLKRNLFLRLLVPETGKDQYIEDNRSKLDREIRYLPQVFSFQTTIITYGNEVSIMLSVRPYSAIVINNEEVAKTFKMMYEHLWSISRQVG